MVLLFESLLVRSQSEIRFAFIYASLFPIDPLRIQSTEVMWDEVCPLNGLVIRQICTVRELGNPTHLGCRSLFITRIDTLLRRRWLQVTVLKSRSISLLIILIAHDEAGLFEIRLVLYSSIYRLSTIVINQLFAVECDVTGSIDCIFLLFFLSLLADREVTLARQLYHLAPLSGFIFSLGRIVLILFNGLLDEVLPV